MARQIITPFTDTSPQLVPYVRVAGANFGSVLSVVTAWWGMLNTMAEWPMGSVTILFTVVGGSPRHWEADPDDMRVELAAHDNVLRTAIEDRDGWLFKHTGDGVGDRRGRAARDDYFGPALICMAARTDLTYSGLRERRMQHPASCSANISRTCGCLIVAARRII